MQLDPRDDWPDPPEDGDEMPDETGNPIATAPRHLPFKATIGQRGSALRVPREDRG